MISLSTKNTNDAGGGYDVRAGEGGNGRGGGCSDNVVVEPVLFV